MGLFSVNRAEWIIAEQACYQCGAVTVPLYDTLGDDAIAHIIEETRMGVCFVSADKIQVLLKLRDRIGSLRTIVAIGTDVSKELRQQAKRGGIEVLAFEDAEAAGAQAKFVATPPKPTDLCTICYTSGTTGSPKGVMLTHSAILAASSSVVTLVGRNPLCPNEHPIHRFLESGETYLSYLPLAHVFERTIMHTLIILGFRVGFYQGDVAKIMDDVAELEPTLFVGVPRVFNRIHDRVLSTVASGNFLVQWVFNHALAEKTRRLEGSGGETLTHWLWDRLVFRSVRDKLGGKIRVMLTGSAPLSGPVLSFLRTAFSSQIFEGYGLTETSAVTCLTCAHDLTPGQVGVPAPHAEVKLVDLADMGYTSRDEPNPRGEIYIRSTSSFTGYYNNPATTAETLKNGWVATGDIGMWDAHGRLCIIDRKKSMFKLAQGEYVAPEKIEAILCQLPPIDQAYVEGNSLRTFVVAVIVPNKRALMAWAQKHHVDGTYEEVCKDPETKADLLRQLQQLGSLGSKELKGFEVPRDIYLEARPFTVENGLATPTFKLKRPIAKKRYAQAVADMYAATKD